MGWRSDGGLITGQNLLTFKMYKEYVVKIYEEIQNLPSKSTDFQNLQKNLHGDKNEVCGKTFKTADFDTDYIDIVTENETKTAAQFIRQGGGGGVILFTFIDPTVRVEYQPQLL